MYDFTSIKKDAVYIRHYDKNQHYSLKYLPPHLVFTDKESYLQWVADWKVEYAAVTKEIRALRHELSKPHQIVTRNGWTFSDASSNQGLKQHLRDYAYSLLLLRQMGKRRSYTIKRAMVV